MSQVPAPQPLSVDPATDREVYRGRFAPSPTGPLHFGSLVAAVGSFADARANRGEWVVRIEDLDPPRTVPGAADAILRTLEACGLHWDGPLWYQSGRLAAYAEALAQLRAAGHTFVCGCSRREIAVRSGPPPAGADGPIYPGTCRHGLPPGRRPRSERVTVGDARIAFVDQVHGPIEQDLAQTVGDFVLHRADGVYAYQLAVVVDDRAQGVNRIVRGTDLLASTPRQLYLQRLLGGQAPGAPATTEPHYAHLPLVLGEDGRKLSKSLAALPVDPDRPLPTLLAAWRFLGQVALSSPPDSVAAFWAQAIPAWRLARVPTGAAPVGPTVSG